MAGLIFVGVLYMLSGLWCAWQPDLASNYLGFSLASPLAYSEFFSVYGGLQCGLAVAILLSSFRPAYREAASFFALCFSLVLLLFRAASMVMEGVYDEILYMLVLELFISTVLFFSWSGFRSQMEGSRLGSGALKVSQSDI